MSLLKTTPTKVIGSTRIWNGKIEKKDIFTIGVWIINAPWMHLAWDSYFVSLVHLRDTKEGKPAVLQFPEATHEFLVFALDKKKKLTWEDFKYLTPANIIQQFISNSDVEALEIIEILLDRVLNQTLSLDEDYRSIWKHLLLEHTIKDFRE